MASPDDPRHPCRRAGDAAVAVVAHRAAQAVPVADRQAAARSRKRCSASPTPAATPRRSSSPMPSTASSSASRPRSWASRSPACCSSRWRATPPPRSPPPRSSPSSSPAPQRVIHVLPSDHAVDTDDNYWASVDTAAKAAAAGRLVTFGIAPTAPETGYGYIEAGAARGDGTREVARFVEKPDLDKAEAMLEAGRLLLELRHVHARRRHLPRRVPRALARELRRRPRRGREGQDRSRFHPPRRGELRQGAQHLGRLRHLRKDQADRLDPGHLLLVRPRQLGRGVEGLATRTPARTPCWATRRSATPPTRSSSARRRTSPSRASTMSR